jgi:GTPase SAR1 family protein
MTSHVPIAAEYVKEKPLDIQMESGKSYSFCLLGSTRSGKTTCLNHLLKRYFMKHINILMSDSLHAEIYKPLMKTVVAVPTYVPEIIKSCFKINRGTDNRYPFNVILDDLVGYRNDKTMLRLLTIGRNQGTNVMITAQATTILSASGRTNINHVLLFKLNSDEQIETVCKKFLSSFFPSHMRMIDRIIEYKRLTSNYHFIYLNNITGESYVSKIDPDD